MQSSTSSNGVIPCFFFVPTLVSSAIKAHSVLRAVLNAKKKVVPQPGNFKRASGQYISSPRCSQLFNHESLAPNLYKHTTI